MRVSQFQLISLVQYLSVAVFWLSLSSLMAQETSFGGPVDQGLIRLSRIKEASGIAASQKNPGVLWIHNDSDPKNNIYAMDANGKHLGRLRIGFRKPRDCEDIAVGPGPEKGKSYIYLGDIGDNKSRRPIKEIYRIPEPNVSHYHQVFDLTLKNISVITYRYPDGRRDAEALMIDPQTSDIFIISKREDSVRVYMAPYPQSLDSDITLTYIGQLPVTMVTGGDISPSGDEVLIKNYFSVYYWKRQKDEIWKTAFQKQPEVLPYIPEPQGESICWSRNGDGYYTTSEEKGNIPAKLYFYPRLK